MAEIEVWNVSDLLRIAREADAGDADWIESVRALGVRAHARGDGVAVYVNADLGHPDLGSWQVVSYGSTESLLETREPVTEVLGKTRHFTHGADNVPMLMPDIGNSINWRYTLRAIVPSYEQKV